MQLQYGRGFGLSIYLCQERQSIAPRFPSAYSPNFAMSLIRWFPLWFLAKRHPVSTSDAQASIRPREEGALRFEIIRVALRASLTRHGIPPNWVAAEIQPAPTLARQSRADILLVVKQWGALPWARAAAFQQTFDKRLALLDPHRQVWLRSVLWQFSADVAADIEAGSHRSVTAATSSLPPAPQVAPAVKNQLPENDRGAPGAESAQPVPPGRAFSSPQLSATTASASPSAAARLLRRGRESRDFMDFQQTVPLDEMDIKERA